VHASGSEADLNSLIEQPVTTSLANEFVRFWCAVTRLQRIVDFSAVSPVYNAACALGILRRVLPNPTCDQAFEGCLTCARLRTPGRRNV
jgi:hypothetical protein